MTHVYNWDPLQIGRHYEIDYIHSYGAVSRYFHGLKEKKLWATRCPKCGATWLPPRRDCGKCGARAEWFEAPTQGKVHTFSVLHFAGEAFLKDLPFTLVYVELPGIDTMLLSRLVGVKPEEVRIGMPVKARFSRLPEWSASDVWFEPV
jgi:uncharacterized OB-fold protein